MAAQAKGREKGTKRSESKGEERREKRKRQIVQWEGETGVIYVSEVVVDVLLTRDYLSLASDVDRAREERETERAGEKERKRISTDLISHYLVKAPR